MSQHFTRRALLTSASALLVCQGLLSSAAYAQNQIIRPFQGIRSLGMGGTRITTGLYEDNFFGNPARITQNPKWKVQILDIFAESTTDTLSNVGDLLSNTDDMIQALGQTAGTNTHVRAQTLSPAFYLPNLGKWSVAFGVHSSVQADVLVRRSYQFSPIVTSDLGATLQVARRFLDQDALSVGLAVRGQYRVSSDSGFTFLDLIQGQDLGLSNGADGGSVDTDLGATYRLPKTWKEWEFTVGGSVTNLLGGKFNQFNLGIMNGTALPTPQNRSFNLGVSAERETLGKFNDTVVALEFTDLGNNLNGSFFRTIHIGAETRYGILRPRLGINQGYLAAGFGLDLKFVALDFATYGEEMSLNTGGTEDRRFAVRLGFQI